MGSRPRLEACRTCTSSSRADPRRRPRSGAEDRSVARGWRRALPNLEPCRARPRPTRCRSCSRARAVRPHVAGGGISEYAARGLGARRVLVSSVVDPDGGGEPRRRSRVVARARRRGRHSCRRRRAATSARSELGRPWAARARYAPRHGPARVADVLDGVLGSRARPLGPNDLPRRSDHVRHRRHLSLGNGRARRSRPAARHDRRAHPSRAGRLGAVRDGAGRAGAAAAVDRRPVGRGAEPDAERGRDAAGSRSTARSTTCSSGARSSRRAATASAATPTPRCCCTCTRRRAIDLVARAARHVRLRAVGRAAPHAARRARPAGHQAAVLARRRAARSRSRRR